MYKFEFAFKWKKQTSFFFEIKKVEKITTLYDFEINTRFDTRKRQIQIKGKSKKYNQLSTANKLSPKIKIDTYDRSKSKDDSMTILLFNGKL